MLGLCINIIQVYFRNEIAAIFDADPKIQKLVAFNMLIFVVDVFNSLYMYSLSSILRVLGYYYYQMYFNVVVYPLCIIFFDYYFGFHMKLKVMGIIIAFVVSKSIIIWSFILKTYFLADWSENNKALVKFSKV